MSTGNSPLTSESGFVRRAQGVFYGWRLVGAGAFMLMLMSVCVFQGMGLFLVTLERHFGWSRTQLSLAFSFGRLEGAVLGPVEGFLIDRLGNRRMILIGYTIMGIGFLMFSQVQSLWQFYAVFVLISLGSGLGGWLAVISLINNWFVRKRSMAMASTMSGVHLGGFLVPVLAIGLESHGFRVTTFGIGIFLLITVLPVARLVIRNHPEEFGLHPDGDPPMAATTQAEGATTAPSDEQDFTARQALATPAFWIITIAHISSTISIVTLSLHLVPKLTDMGLTLTSASLVVLTYTAVALPAQFVAGFAADRLPKRPLILFFLVLQASSVMVIAFADSVYTAYLFAVMFGIGFGGRTPLLTAIRGEYFGRKAFATIMGLSMTPMSITMMVAPPFAGYMFDTTGSYVVPFTAFSVVGFLGAFPVLFMRKPKAVGVRSEDVSHHSAS